MRESHILLIDDDEDEYDIFTTALDAFADTVKCTYARGAEDAVKLLNYILPDYIFLDINMPGRNGLECLVELKKIKMLEQTPVFLYSTYIDDSTAKEGTTLGATASIQKPQRISMLTRILKKILEGGKFENYLIRTEKTQ